MLTDFVRAGKLVIMEIKAGSPIGRRGPAQNWNKAVTLHVVWNCDAGGFQEGLWIVEHRNDCLASCAGFDNAGPTNHQWRRERFFVNPAFVEPAVFTEIEALIG